MSNLLKAKEGVELLNLDQETGAPPQGSRLKDVTSARAIYVQLREADKPSAENRAQVQAMFDSVPPYSEAELKRTGQGFRTNLNFDEAAGALENAMASYVDLDASVETLVKTPTLFGDDETQRHEFSEILAEEVTRAIRSWPKYNHTFLLNCHYFISQGVSISYFENDTDWRWQVSRFGDFFIPRATRATEEDLEISCCVKNYPIHELYEYIRDEEIARKSGWNVEQVKQAILGAVDNHNSRRFDDWEALQEELKNNDLYYSHATNKTVRVVHFWVQEFDGKVSHFIATETSVSNPAKIGVKDDFLFKKPNRFNNINQALTIFTYGIGTNGLYHGIRGLGYKIFPHIQVSNRLRNQLVDGAMMSSSVILQPENEKDLDRLSLTYYGPYAVVNPGLNVVPNGSPNYTNNAIPVLNDMSQMFQNRTGQYSTNNVFQNNKDRTRYEVAAHLDYAAKLSSTNLNLYYGHKDKLLREVVRRISRKGYHAKEPGGEYVANLHKRLASRGVPLEALYNIDIDGVHAIRGVGGGSSAARSAALQDLTTVMPAFDEVGRHNLLRDKVAARVGRESADRYVPPKSGTRPVVDEKLAEMENAHMLEGTPMTVQSTEFHVPHLRKHTELIAQIADEVSQGAADLVQMTQPMILLHDHSMAHLEFIQGDPSLQEETALLRQAMQQAGEVINNGLAQLERQQQEGEAQGGEGQPSPEQVAKFQEHQMKLQMMKEEHDIKMALRIQEAETDLAIKDAKSAQDIRTYL